MKQENSNTDASHTCRHCGESIIPKRHDDTGLSCPECGIALSYSDVTHYKTTTGEIKEKD